MSPLHSGHNGSSPATRIKAVDHRLRRFKVVRLVCGLCCALAVGQYAAPAQQAPGGQQAAAETAFRAGLKAVQAGRLAEAKAQFERVVQLAPTIAAGHSALGAVLVRQAKFAQAIVELRNALKLDGADASAKLNLGLATAALVQGPPQLSVSESGVLAREGMDALHSWQAQRGSALPVDGALALAKLELATGNPAAAKQGLDDALMAAPNDPTLLDATGVLLALQKSFAEAEQRFRSALAALPADAAARSTVQVHLGSAMLAGGDPAGAVQVLEQAVREHPNDTAARVQLGAAQFSAGQESAAVTTLRFAVQQSPADTAAAYQLALTLQSQGHADEALTLFQRVQAQRPNDPELLTNTGLALVELGRAKEAVPLYERAATLEPASSTLRQDLGVAYLQQSDLDHAIAEFRKGLELEPGSAQLAYDLGLALKLKDNLPDAIIAFEKAKALDPTLADAPYTLGVLYMQQGQFDDAAKSLRQALVLRPDNADAWAMLGSVLKQNGKPQESADALRKAIALDPGQPGNHVNLASVLVELGQKDEAIRERKTAADLSRAATGKQKERFALDSGTLLRQRGQFAEAAVQFRAAIAADPNDPAAHTALADVLAQSGATAEAEAERAKAKALVSR